MGLCTARFNLGTNGATIAAGDPGNATPFDSITIPAGSVLAYDNTHAHSGTLAAKLTGGTGNVTVFLGWQTPFGTLSEHYGRSYLYLTANPDASFALMQASVQPVIRLNADGTLAIRVSGVDVTTTVAAIALNQWVRIEWHIVHDPTTGSVELKLFNTTDSLTPTETITATAQNLGSNSTSWTYRNARAALTYWLDDIAAGADSYPGPLLSSLLPTDQRVTRNILLRR